MYLFKNLKFSDFSKIEFEPVQMRDEFTQSLFENEILFLDIKLIPFTSQISHYLLFGIPDAPLKIQSLKGVTVYVQNIYLGDRATFERLFQKWFMDSSHTLVTFDSLDILPQVVKNLNLSSFECNILDLSLLLRLSRNGLPKNNTFIWELLKDGLNNKDKKDLNVSELENKFNQLQQEKKFQNWKEMEHNVENVQFLSEEVLKIGFYLLGYCGDRDIERNYWYTSFAQKRIHGIEIYYSFFEPLIEPFVFLSMEGLKVDTQNNKKIQLELNLQYPKLQKKFQKYFQMDLMDLQSMVLALSEKFEFPLPLELLQTPPIKDFDEIAIMDGKFLQTAAQTLEMDCTEIQLLAEGLIWRQNNLSFMQNTLKIQNQRIFLK